MKKDQFVIAYLTDLTDTDVVVSHALFLSKKLRKGLVLLHISDSRYTKTSTAEAEEELKKICSTLESSSYAALAGDTKEIITSLPTLMNAVVIVAQVAARAARRSPLNRRNVLRNFAECRAAFLTVQQPFSVHPVDDTPAGGQTSVAGGQPDEVAMVVDFKRESKDKFIWSSYFPRFIGSRMNVLYYDYKDQFLHSKWYANMQQLHKLYTGLDITFQPRIMESKSTFPDVDALRFARSHGYRLLICVTTKERDTLEYIIGTQEMRTITNRYRIPILFLNPREDLYVICD